MSARPADRRVGADDAPQLGEDALLRGAGQPRRVRADRRRRVGVDLEAELGRPGARRAACAADRRRTRSALTMRRRLWSRSRAPPWGSTSSPPASGSAIALTVRSRAREVGLERAALQRRDVDLPAAVAARPRARRRTGRRARTRRRRRRGPGCARPGARRRRRRRRGRASGAPAGDRAARRPRATRARPASASRSGLDHSATPSRWCSRGTRARQRARDLVVDGAQPPRHLLGAAAPPRDEQRLVAALDAALVGAEVER